MVGFVTERHAAFLACAGFLTLVVALAGCNNAVSAPPPAAQRQVTASPAPAITVVASPSPSPAAVAPATGATSIPAPEPTATPAPPPTKAPLKPTATAFPVATPAVPASSQGPAVDQPGVPTSSLAAAGEKRLAVIQGREWVFVKNGATVSLGNGLSLELFLSPYPPTQLREVLDIYLTRSGEQVTDASASVTYDMLGMVHGPFVSTAKNLGNGHYTLGLDYIEFAAWDHKLVLYLGKGSYELSFGTVVFPGPR